MSYPLLNELPKETTDAKPFNSLPTILYNIQSNLCLYTVYV